jgi:hypothetical protein
LTKALHLRPFSFQFLVFFFCHSVFQRVTTTTKSSDYSSSARTLRWILESGLSTYAACKNGYLLTNNQSDRDRRLSYTKYIRWLKKIDNRQLKFTGPNRINILRSLGFNPNEVKEAEKLYSNLCKHIHLSQISFNMDYVEIPDLTVVLEEFSTIYRLNCKSMDIVMFSLLKSYEFLDNIEDFKDSYRDWFY